MLWSSRCFWWAGNVRYFSRSRYKICILRIGLSGESPGRSNAHSSQLVGLLDEARRIEKHTAAIRCFLVPDFFLLALLEMERELSALFD